MEMFHHSCTAIRILFCIPMTIPSLIFHGTGEDTGTRPDYLVNRVLIKNEGPHPKKIVQKSRNSCKVNSGGGRE